ncbi:hypothetical protein [Bacillus sp. J33]|uniref:hypothetical protein n=1 Tax=Bacillus sp. J33 TaxID=935836 RepID=UPI00047E4176|nr:hypothetical protein [Bacillus sp. J33]
MELWKKRPQRIEAYEHDDQGVFKGVVIISEDIPLPANIKRARPPDDLKLPKWNKKNKKWMEGEKA